MRFHLHIRSFRTLLASTFSAFAAAIWFSPNANAALPLDQIQLPPGFRIELLSAEVPEARGMTLSPEGTLFIGTRGEGKVYAIRNPLAPAPKVRVVATGLNMPVGVAFRDGALYASSTSQIVRLDDIDARLDNPPKPVVVSDRFPPRRITGGSLSPLARMAICMCRSARPAISARPMKTVTPTS